MEINIANVLIALGQLLLGALFVWAGLNHFGPAGEKALAMLQARGVPRAREALYFGSIFEAVCGACLMLGVAVVPAAIGLVIFTVIASVLLVNFWDFPAGELRETLRIIFFSNTAVVGGLLLAAASAL